MLPLRPSPRLMMSRGASAIRQGASSICLSAQSDTVHHAAAKMHHSLMRADRLPEAGLQKHAVTRRQYPRGLVGADRNPSEQGGWRIVNPGTEVPQSEFVDDVESLPEAASTGDCDQLDTLRGVTGLHPGLAVVAVIEHRDRQVRRALHAARR